MIKDSLQFLIDEINKYLIVKQVGSTDLPRVVLGNATRAYDTEALLPGAESISNRAIVSVVNIEEDRVSKRQENYTRTDTTIQYKSPPLFINIYMLISVNRNNYGQSLSWLGHIMQFFQHQNVFTPTTHPALDIRIEKLLVELYSLNFEQVNHLWSVLGGKYLPSVLYKVRQVTLDEDLVVSESSFIKEIKLTEKLKQTVSS